MRGHPQTDESLEAKLVAPQAEALLEPVLVTLLPQEPREPVFVETLPGELRRAQAEEEPSESVSLSLRKSLLNAFAVVGNSPLKCFFPFLPSWSRSKWWFIYSHNAFKVSFRGPPSTLADIAGVSTTLLTLFATVSRPPSMVFLCKVLPPGVVRAFPST